jgi:1-acyl-sn-glycerol-3-phosphate acyltransferase
MTQLGLDYPTQWGRQYPARLARNLYHLFYVGPVVRYLSTLDAQGLEHLSGPGPYILVANHTSNFDTPLVLTALPTTVRKRTVVAAAMDNFFMDRWTAFKTVFVFNAIPIDRHKINRRSSQQALELVERGWNLLIFPEGGRTPTGQLQEFKGGAAYLAERTNAAVVPTYIHDAGLLQGPKYAKAPQFLEAPNQKRHHVSVTFGPAMFCAEGENIRRFNTRIEEAVVALGQEVSGNRDYNITRPNRP